MAKAWRARASVAVAITALGFVMAMAVGSCAFAQAPGPAGTPKKAAAKDAGAAGDKKPDPAAALAALDAGVAAVQAGKAEAGVQQLTAALAGGSLQPAQMARAFYFRGVAYRKLNKPAQAIENLTSALWLKNGLAGAERSDAMAQRAASYREAGLSDQGQSGEVAQSAAPAPSAPATPAPVATAPARPTATAAPAPVPAPQQPAGTEVLPWLSKANPDQIAATSVRSAPREPVAVQAPAAPPVQEASVQPAPSSGGSQGGGFWSNLFGGGTPASGGTGASTGSLPQSPPQATSAWSASTERRPGAAAGATTQNAVVSPAVSPPPVQRAAADVKSAPADVKSAPASVGGGNYRVQVAAVRSRAEAQDVAQRIKQMHGSDLGRREAVVDETVMGNMGTFYRVRLGPFADMNEPRSLCQKLRAGGFDCLLVTQ